MASKQSVIPTKLKLAKRFSSSINPVNSKNFSSSNLVSAKPSLQQIVSAVIDFSDVHPLSIGGFFNYMNPLLPSKFELEFPTPQTPPVGHRKNIVASASNYFDVDLLFIPVKAIRRGKWNKSPHDKPTHKVACPSAFVDDCWSVDTTDLS
jgi:hypothetical protein